ncbi:MAG: MATE family efflux transporter [Holosporales bacterium]|jgi:MATE family multidrug resistance protein|nr:MATE family efflux transporter [Holosporales bacterium]
MRAEIIDCSLRSVIRITLPAMLTSASVNLMYVIDRFMLAGYSIDAMNASVSAGNFVAIFTLAFIGMASSAETFVGQYNGARQYSKIATPVWQMIYLSLASAAVTLPLAYFSEQINFLPPYYLKDGIEYQQTLMYWAFLPPIKAALAAFFIGQGKTRIVTAAVILGVVSNVGLDYILIYGIRDIIPRLGCRGAAIATVASEFIQIVMLASLFVSAKNCKVHKVLKNRQFDKKLFDGCCRIGWPLALGNFMAMLAWYILQVIMSYVSKQAVTVYNIGINLYIFFIFLGEGVNKGAVAICSNMIGRDDLVSIEKTRKIFVKISVFFGLTIAVPLVLFPEWLLSVLGCLPDDISGLYSEIKLVTALVAIEVVFETLLLSTWGILTAGGDTRYATMVYQGCVWVLVVLPSVVLYYFDALNSVPMVYLFMMAWVLITWLVLHHRYRSMKWYNKLV